MRRLLIICLLSLSLGASALDREALEVRFDSLVSLANRAYLKGQTSEIRRLTEEVSATFDALDPAGPDRREMLASLTKLRGDIEYLRGCAGDSLSFMLAERFFRQAMSYKAQRFSTNALLYLELAQLFYKTGRYYEALQYLDLALDYYDTTGIYEPGDTEWNSLEMQKAITLARLGRFTEARTLAASAIGSFSDRKSLDYARARRMQAKILGLSGAPAGELVKAYREFFDMQKKYALENFRQMNSGQREEYWMMIRPFVTDAYALEDADPEFLYDLTLFAKGLLLQLDTGSAPEGSPSARQLKSLSYTWRDIRSKLRKGEAAVEFVQYMPFRGLPRMGAIVLRHGDRPRWVFQPAPGRIDGLFGSDIDDGERWNKDRVYRGDRLAGLVWTPELRKALGDAKTVFFAPDGCYHNIAIEYVLPDSTVEARRLTSTRRLMERGSESRSFSATDPMLLFGDIDYYTNPSPEAASDNDRDAYITFLHYDFPLLGEETDEARKIAKMRNMPDDVRQRGIFATEGAFRRLTPRFRSVLVSTHGISLSTKEHLSFESDLRPAVSDDALSSSVLGLTGVNPCVQNSAYDAGKYYDGLISARELASLDLSDCRLFTMSACQTGLGVVTADGVYGLQRGLKNAGVGAMLLSLWSVQSDATSRLMTSFYSRLSKGETLHQAFRNARRDLMEGKISDEQLGLVESESVYVFDPATLSGKAVPTASVPYYNLPQYTHAFILIDALE